MANLDKQLPAVINDTTTAVAMLEPKLEAVYNQIVGIGQINTNFTNLTNNFVDMSNHFTKVNNVMKNTSVQSSKVVSKVNNISLTMNAGAKVAKNYGNVFKSLASGFSYVAEASKKIWAAMESTSDYLKVYNSYKDTFSEIAGAWSADYEKYGYENAEAYAESYTNRMNETFSKLSGVRFDDKNMSIASNDVKNLGLSLEEVTKCATDLASVTSSIGFSGEESLASIGAITKLAGDLSAKYDVDYSTVGQALVNGIAGQTDALGGYGINLSDENLQNYATVLGIDKLIVDMSQAEQMQLRIIAILKETQSEWGNLADSMNQPSVQLSMLKNNFMELIQTLGQLFMPLLQKILPFINGIIIAAKTLIANLANLFDIEMEFPTQEISGMAQEYDVVSESVDGVADSVKKAKTHLLGIDELNVAESDESTDSSANAKNSGVDLSSKLSGILGDYENMWEKAYADMENKAQEFATSLGVMFLPIENMFRDIKIGDWFAVGEDVSDIVTGIYSFFATAIASVDWKQLGENIGEFLRGVNWTEILFSTGELIGSAIGGAFELYKWVFDSAPLETAIITTLGLLNYTGLGDLIATGLKKVILSKLPEVASVFSALFGKLAGSSAATSAWTLMGDGIKNITGIATVVGGAILSVANFIDMLNDGFNWLNEILMIVGIGITAVGAMVLGAPAVATAIVAGIATAIATLVIVVKDNWDAIVAWTTGLFTSVSTVFLDLWSVISGVWSVVAIWFDENVIQPIVDFFVGFATRIGQVFEGLWIIMQAVWISVSTWFNENVIVPLWNLISPFVDGVLSFFTNLWNGIVELGEAGVLWLKQNVINPLSMVFEMVCNTIGGFFSSLWEGIKGGVIGTMNVMISGIETGINFIVNGINLIIGGFNKIVSWAAQVAEVEWGGVDLVPNVIIPRIPTYEVGGFPEDGLFMANHGELVGGFSNGRTAVVNNEQIVGGIKLGVRDAVSEVLAPYLADIAENTRETANKEFATYIGDKEIARASERGRRAIGLQIVT